MLAPSFRVGRRSLLLRGTAALATPLLLAACGGETATSTNAPSGAAATAGTLVFGAAISLTGSTAKEGTLTKEGYDIWRDVYNDAGGIKVGSKKYRIETKYYDDESSGPKSATLADKLINEDKIDFLLGPYGTTSTLQVSTVAEKNKMPHIEGNGAAESIFSQGYSYTFGVLSPAKNYLAGVVDMFAAQSPKPATAVLLTADDAFSVEVADATKAYAEKKGIMVVYYQKYPNGATELRAPLTEAKAKNADLFLNSGHLAESIAAVQQARELGFNAKGWAFSVGPGTPDFQSTLKADADFVFGGSQWTPFLKYNGDDLFKTPAAYNDLYLKRFGHEPAYQSADGTACGVAFVKAIEKAASTDKKAVRDAIAKLDFISFYGQIKFDERGINIYKPMSVEQWQSGKRNTVWPAEAANAKPLWPTPAWNAR